MQLEIPDDILRHAEANATDLRIALAVQLYADNRIDHGEAVRLSGLSIPAFNRELLSRQLSIQQYPKPTRRPRRSAG
ncbi:MAG: UPF0175 family protein [Phycisphaerae bacterium]|nr:UPF0175 family protein [Phycisphaerae bacterium]